MTHILVLFDKLIPFRQFKSKINFWFHLNVGDLLQEIFVQFQNSCFPELAFATKLCFCLKRLARITGVQTHKES